jgi:hypothetical protein
VAGERLVGVGMVGHPIKMAHVKVYEANLGGDCFCLQSLYIRLICVWQISTISVLRDVVLRVNHFMPLNQNFL